ncbi:MAG: DUF3619 family protein [Burkholderiaceae bacterium]
MNETRFVSAIRQALDQSTRTLPLRVTQRLEQARSAALAGVPEPPPGHAAPAHGACAVYGPVRIPKPVRMPVVETRPYLAWRIMACVVPAVLLASGFVIFGEMHAEREALAQADSAPAVAVGEAVGDTYADRGLGSYLQKTSLSSGGEASEGPAGDAGPGKAGN